LLGLSDVDHTKPAQFVLIDTVPDYRKKKAIPINPAINPPLTSSEDAAFVGLFVGAVSVPDASWLCNGVAPDAVGVGAVPFGEVLGFRTVPPLPPSSRGGDTVLLVFRAASLKASRVFGPEALRFFVSVYSNDSRRSKEAMNWETRGSTSWKS